jgi:AraC-like DNA-binding protein
MASVFILREMPDFELLKPKPENATYRAWFYSRWGRENCIVRGTGRNAEYTQFRQRLSIKVARGGRERYYIDGRTIAVDDDSFLILNDNRCYGSRFESDIDLESYSIFFRPGMAEEVTGALATPVERAIDEGGAAPRAVEFTETLHPHDSLVSPMLRYIRHGVLAGVDDGDWYEEQLQFLLARMLAHQRRVADRVGSLPLLRSATRHEIQRRLSLAVDLVHASYDRDIGLAQMAEAACLSKFHFLRLFTELHGLTPHAYLQRKRSMAAQRLLEEGSHTGAQVARRVGFRSRSTMARQMKRWATTGQRTGPDGGPAA